MNEDIHWALENGVATLTINRLEKLNAFRELTTAGLTQGLLRANEDDQVKTVVITGAGRAFSAGIDLSMIKTEPEIELGEILVAHFEPIFQAIRNLEKPLIAAVNGPAAGVSVGIALNADLCVMRQSAYLLVPFVPLGLIPDGSLTWMLPRLAGNQTAAGLALLADKMPADECERRGLIWRAVADENYEQELRNMAQKLAAQPPLAVALTNQALRASDQNSWEEQLSLERELQDQCGKTNTFKETRSSFLKRR